MPKKQAPNVFVAATGQHVGKTTTCLGLYAKLQKSGYDAGFIKPVGQRYMDVEDRRVDEDSYLIYKIYDLDCELQDMNPVAVPRGFTEEYIDNADNTWITKAIGDAYAKVTRNRDFVLIEGTGHTGVGSVFDTSNADVAKMLGSKVILVTDGGIGRAIDQLMLNKGLFDMMGVSLLGVIVNKVYEEKYDKIKDFVERSLEAKGIKLLGVIPFQRRLLNPTMGQICSHLGGTFLAGEEHAKREADKITVGAMSVSNFLHHIKGRTLVITPGDREDLILASLSWNLSETSAKNQIAGVVVTGNVKPGRVVARVMRNSEVPVVFTEFDSFETASRVHDLQVKIQVTDSKKIALSQNLFDTYVDFDYIMANC
jgi:dethiobiotin synthase